LLGTPQLTPLYGSQMRPNYHPEGLYEESKASSSGGERPMAQLWHQNGRCPEGTVPIRRTRKDDLLRASSMRRYGRKRRAAANPMSVSPTMLNEGGHQVPLFVVVTISPCR
jgi:hypothetical protein